MSIFTNFSDLGIHIDGFIALAAHSLVVGKAPSVQNEEEEEGEEEEEVKEDEEEAGPWTGKRADVIVAAHKCI